MTIPHAILPAPRVTSEQVLAYVRSTSPGAKCSPVTGYRISRRDRRESERALAKLLAHMSQP